MQAKMYAGHTVTHSGRNGPRPEGMQDISDKGHEGCTRRTQDTHDGLDAEHNLCRTGLVQDKMDAGHSGA